MEYQTKIEIEEEEKEEKEKETDTDTGGEEDKTPTLQGGTEETDEDNKEEGKKEEHSTLQGGTEETDEDNKGTEEGKKEVDSKETATDYGIISGGAIVAVLVLLGVGAIIAIIVYRKRRYVLVYPMDDCYTIEPEHAP